ncbi:MAG TPA: ABC transporter permease [Solirubrobacteraceae bacterium]|nr:ABC transporter permease [Solirubrobacteraceae bacterium]
MRRVAAAFASFALAALALAFIVLPLAALLTHEPLGRLIDQIPNPVVTDALLVSAKTSAIAQAAVLAFGTPLAWLLATRRFPGRTLAMTLVELPIVLPPAVAGIGLIVAFGRLGLLGGAFSALGIDVSFNQAAVVLAVAFVGGPLYVRTAAAAFESLDARLLDASRTLGAGPAKTFFRVALPLAAPGLSAGAALSLARGLGEFGATIMFAGSLQGVTQTAPLAIYAEFDTNLDVAIAISALFVVIIAAVLLSLKLNGLWQSSRRASRFRYAISPSR